MRLFDKVKAMRSRTPELEGCREELF
jgi:hypothetical protein